MTKKSKKTPSQKACQHSWAVWYYTGRDRICFRCTKCEVQYERRLTKAERKVRKARNMDNWMDILKDKPRHLDLFYAYHAFKEKFYDYGKQEWKLIRVTR